MWDGRAKEDGQRVATRRNHIGLTTPCSEVARSALTPDDLVIESGETVET
jgi:hypothetical protein